MQDSELVCLWQKFTKFIQKTYKLWSCACQIKPNQAKPNHSSVAFFSQVEEVKTKVDHATKLITASILDSPLFSSQWSALTSEQCCCCWSVTHKFMCKPKYS